MDAEDYSDNGYEYNYHYYTNGTVCIFSPLERKLPIGKLDKYLEVTFTDYGDILHTKTYFTNKGIIGVGWFYSQDIQPAVNLMNRFGIYY